MKVLLKYPTRGRPQQFLTTLKGWLDSAGDPGRISVLVSYDRDDDTMTPDVISRALSMHPQVTVVPGDSKSKIEACNIDLPEYETPWDVVLLISDDMWCRRIGWDSAIRLAMQRYFPDTCGSLWFFDGSQRKINTLSCLGRCYWESFKYIYEPSYKSFWVDNEQTEVGLRDKKLVMIEESICSHEHPSWAAGMKQDALYVRNGKFWDEDKATYYRRKALGFPR